MRAGLWRTAATPLPWRSAAARAAGDHPAYQHGTPVNPHKGAGQPHLLRVLHIHGLEPVGVSLALAVPTCKAANQACQALFNTCAHGNRSPVQQPAAREGGTAQGGLCGGAAGQLRTVDHSSVSKLQRRYGRAAQQVSMSAAMNGCRNRAPVPPTNGATCHSPSSLHCLLPPLTLSTNILLGAPEDSPKPSLSLPPAYPCPPPSYG